MDFVFRSDTDAPQGHAGGSVGGYVRSSQQILILQLYKNAVLWNKCDNQKGFVWKIYSHPSIDLLTIKFYDLFTCILNFS